MPIPGRANITEKHIREAIEMIDREGYDPMYEAAKYVLLLNGRDYPPKHVVRLANKSANGGTLNDLTFYPSEAKRLLEKRGFTIQERGAVAPPRKLPNDQRYHPPVKVENSVSTRLA